MAVETVEKSSPTNDNQLGDPEDDLDDLLDDALGDFSSKKSPEIASPSSVNSLELAFEEEFSRQLNLELQGFPDSAASENNFFEKLVQSSTETNLTKDKTKIFKESRSADSLKTFHSTIDNTMNKLKNSSEQVKAEVKEDSPEALMEQLMRQMEGLSDSPDFEQAIEGMMSHILTKDLLYEPMKDLLDKYPEWLAKNKGEMSAKDYNLYCQQHRVVSEVVKAYEKQTTDEKGEVLESEENTKLQKRVMQLMEEMQELGQPPTDLLKMISPDLEVDEDGQPKVPKELEECSLM